jgi:hypothetical protein
VGLPTAAANLLQLDLVGGGTTPDENSIGITVGLILLVTLVGILGNVVLQGALIHGTVSDLAGRGAGVMESLNAGMRHFLTLVGIGILAFFAILVGFIFFIVPGVLLSLAWSVAAPAAVMERIGVFGAFSRSLELTRNHRAAIFGLAVILFVVQFVIQLVASGVVFATVGIGSITAGAAGQTSVAFIVGQAVATFVVQTLVGTLSAAGIASVYYELRQVKEGVGAEQLASVFD